MPLGYGSLSSVPAKLLTSEIGYTVVVEERSSLTTFLRILITIGEIVVALIPGIGVVAETGVALAGGIANEALDISEGNASVTGALFNFAAPLVGGGFSGLKNFKNAGKFLGEFGYAEKYGNRFEGLLSSAYTSVEEGGRRFLTQDVFNAMRQTTRIEESFGMLSGFEKFNKGNNLFPKGLLKSGWSGAVEEAGFDNFMKITTGRNPRLLTIGDNIAMEIDEDKRFSNFLEKSGLSTAKQWELKSLLRGVNSFEEQRSLILGFVRNLGERDALRMFRAVSGEIEVVALNEAWQLPFARQMMHEFDEFAAKTLNKEFLEKEVPSLWKRIVRKVGSPRFNDKIVQRGQLIDPNDAGRAGVEHLYQIVKKQIRKYFKKFEKIFDAAEGIEDAFVAGGGLLVDSDWHLGYKIMKDLGVNKQLVQITYGKDTGRYRHVLCFMNDAELKRYILNPGHVYDKEWAYSKGGKALGLDSMFSMAGIKSLGNQAATILGFIPVQALKNVLSLVSNYVENGAGIADGSYSNSYVKKFTTSLRNSVISRSFRLLGKEIVGGAVGAALGSKIGNFIGKEAQRVGTQVLATGIKNVISGKDFSNGLAAKAEAGALVSVRSNLLRNLRNRQPNSVIAQTLSARRKLQQVNRIPNAVMVGRPYKGIKF